MKMISNSVMIYYILGKQGIILIAKRRGHPRKTLIAGQRIISSVSGFGCTHVKKTKIRSLSIKTLKTVAGTLKKVTVH